MILRELPSWPQLAHLLDDLALTSFSPSHLPLPASLGISVGVLAAMFTFTYLPQGESIPDGALRKSHRRRATRVMR